MHTARIAVCLQKVRAPARMCGNYTDVVLCTGREVMAMPKVNKSAKTGKFVSGSTVKKNPSTTYQQTTRPARPKKTR